MPDEISRRTFVAGSLLSSAGLAIAGTSHAADSPQAAGPPAAQAGMPRGKIGKLEISRLILGGNLLTHFTHSRDLRYVYSLAARYNTDDKILETLATAEAHGINTLTIHNPPHPMSVLRRCRKERRQDPVDHLPHRGGGTGPGPISPAGRGADQGWL